MQTKKSVDSNFGGLGEPYKEQSLPKFFECRWKSNWLQGKAKKEAAGKLPCLSEFCVKTDVGKKHKKTKKASRSRFLDLGP